MMLSNQLPSWWQRAQVYLWSTNINDLPTWQAFLLVAGRILFRLMSDVREGQLTLRAMSLVYTTLLSLVPLLALSFSVFKAFGIHNQLEPLLMNFLAPLGEKGDQLAGQIVQFVENMNVGVLGFLGLLLLVYTVVSLIQKVESAFNFIWRVSSLRSISQRLSGYLSVVMVGPMLVVTAMGITASVANTALVKELITIEPFGMLFVTLSKLVPYLLVIAAFTVTYVIIPNTAVRFRSALVGGIVAGILWESVGWGFASFIAGSGKYTAVYSGFAILIFFLVWLYLNWMVLLLGASIAFYHQNPAYQTARGERVTLSTFAREALALEIIRLVSAAYHEGRQDVTVDSLAENLHLPREPVARVVATLCEAGLLLHANDDNGFLIPGRDVETITIKSIFEAIAGHISEDAIEIDFASEPVRDVMLDVDQATRQHLQDRNIRDLLPGTARSEAQ